MQGRWEPWVRCVGWGRQFWGASQRPFPRESQCSWFQWYRGLWRWFCLSLDRLSRNCLDEWWLWPPSVMFGSNQIQMYQGKCEKTSLMDSYWLSTPECVLEKTKARTEETEDGDRWKKVLGWWRRGWMDETMGNGLRGGENSALRPSKKSRRLRTLKSLRVDIGREMRLMCDRGRLF